MYAAGLLARQRKRARTAGIVLVPELQVAFIISSGLHPASAALDPVNIALNLPGNESSDPLKSNLKFPSPSLSELSPETRAPTPIAASGSDYGGGRRILGNFFNMRLSHFIELQFPRGTFILQPVALARLTVPTSARGSRFLLK